MKHWIAPVLKQKMRQNTPNPISVSIFRESPLDPATGGSASRPPGGEGSEGKGGKGKGREKGGGGIGEGGGREREGEVCVIAVAG